MKNIKWLILGYFMAIFINGCDLGVASTEQSFETNCDGLGSSQWNPVYVRIVD